MNQKDGIFERIACKHLSICNEKGQSLITLGSKENNPMMTFQGNSYTINIYLSDEIATIHILDDGETIPRLELTVDESGEYIKSSAGDM